MSLGHRFPIRARVARHQALAPEAPKLEALNRDRLDRLLGGRDGPRARRLLSFLSSMTLQDGAALITHVKLDDWPSTDRETRQDALSIISNRILVLRARAGLAPFDDPLPGAPPNAFLKLREILGDGPSSARS
jgi:hypothetical protein